MEGRHMITKIERVQNPDLWTRYTQYVIYVIPSTEKSIQSPPNREE